MIFVYFRLEIDKDNYTLLEKTKDVAVLASTLKLFFRELPESLISPGLGKEIRETIKNGGAEANKARRISISNVI